MSDNEKPLDLQAIEARLAALEYYQLVTGSTDLEIVNIYFHYTSVARIFEGPKAEEWARFFLNAPADIAALLGEVKRLRAELSQCLKVVILPADDSDFYMPDEVKE